MARSRFANVPVAFLLTLATGCHHDVATSSTPPPDLAQLALSDIALAFTTPVGQTSRAQAVTLTNTGTAALALSGITLSDTANYNMTSTCASTLASSASCALTIIFKPQSAADHPATIIVTDNDPQTPHTIRINGTSTPVPAK